MEKKTNPKTKEQSSPTDEKSLSGAYPTDLKDRQSVRTTFKISPESAETIRVLAKHHGVSFKEVFDNLSNQFLKERFLKKFAIEEDPDQTPLLLILAHIAKKYMAEKGDKYDDRQKGLVRKSQVVSRGALRTLNDVSKEYQISRDLLVDWSLAIMRDKFEKDIEKTREKYKEAAEIVAEFESRGSQLEMELEELLDSDDPILKRFGLVMVLINNLHLAIKAYQNDGTPIDPDDFSQSG